MIIRHIQNLRSKPVHVRRKLALLYTTFFFLLIVAFWVSSLPFILGNSKPVVAKAPSPFQTVSKPVQDNISLIKKGMASAAESFNIFK